MLFSKIKIIKLEKLFNKEVMCRFQVVQHVTPEREDLRGLLSTPFMLPLSGTAGELHHWGALSGAVENSKCADLQSKCVQWFVLS